MKNCETCGDFAEVVKATYELRGFSKGKTQAEVCTDCVKACKKYRPHHAGGYEWRLVAN